MGFIVAIIGRYGVGKSALSQSFQERGVQVVDLDDQLLALVKGKSADIWKAYLSGEYDQIDGNIPILSQSEVLTAFAKIIESQTQTIKESVVILPSFLQLDSVILNVFDYIVAVDCSDALQKRYLQAQGLSDVIIDQIRQSGFDRSYYKLLATDIFLNSVRMDQIDWVTAQMLKTYRLVDKYT